VAAAGAPTDRAFLDARNSCATVDCLPLREEILVSDVIQGYIVGYRSTADGSLTCTIEFDEFQQDQFHQMGMRKGVAVALARLNLDSPNEQEG
jgi:hypothetical protein